MLALLLLAPLAAHAQALPPAHYPALPATAADAPGFVPPGWALEARQSGDLNGDGRADLALALHQADPRNVIPNEGGMCGDTIDTNPRILAVALAVPSGGYALAMQNHSLVPRYDNACAEDWFASDSLDGAGITIARGTLQVGLVNFMSAGGWSMGSSRFTFRLQQGALRLIGFDYLDVRRNTGEMTRLSVNYLTRKARIARGTTDSDKESVRWSALPARPLLTIDQVGDGMEFDAGGLAGG